MKTTRKILCFVLLTALFASLCLTAQAAEVSGEPTVDPEAVNSVLYGMDVLFVGDSICEAWCERESIYQNYAGWAGRIALSDGINSYNFSKGGASMSDCRGTNTVQVQLQKACNRQYDLVVLHGGVNDAWDGAPVGEMADGFKMSSFDRTTLAGGLEFTFAYARKAYPDAKLCFIINFRLPRAQAGVSLRDMSAYFDLAKKICDKWEIPYLDLYNNEEVNSRLMVATGTVHLPDHIHPSTSGYNILSPYIAEFLRSLYAEPVEESSEEPSVPEEPSAAASEEPSVPDPKREGPSAGMIALIVCAAVVLVGAVCGACIFAKKKKK